MTYNNGFAYCGSIWGKNVGDLAIYQANRELFSDFQLIPGRYATGCQVTLLGGGTILPRALQPEWEIYDAKPRSFNYCIGVGVRDPEFWNRPRSKLDLRYYAGKKGINTQALLRKHKEIGYLIRKVDKILSSTVSIDGYYCLPEEFESIKKFNFNKLGVRGPLSKGILHKYGINATITGDTALYLEPSEYNFKQNKTIIISLKYSGNDKYSVSSDYVSKIVDFCKSHSSEYDFIFMPFNNKDIPIHYRLAKQVPKGDLYLTHHMQFKEILDKIANADLLIGERLHASILASCCYTPFISLEYRPKNKDFARSINMCKFNISLNEITTYKLQNLFEMTMSEYSNIQENLITEVNEKRDKLENFSNEIKREVTMFHS